MWQIVTIKRLFKTPMKYTVEIYNVFSYEYNVSIVVFRPEEEELVTVIYESIVLPLS